MSVNCEELAIDFVPPHGNPRRCEYLVSAARVGSSAAFAELREIYSKRIYRQLFTITKNREDAEDALQDAFLRAYLALDAFEGRSSFYSWLTRIAINSALGILRKRRARLEVSFDRPHDVAEDSVVEFSDEGPSPEQICVHRQRCARVPKSIGKLQPRLRKVIEMRMIQSWSVKEIAQALEISEAAVKSRLVRARGRLIATRAFKNSEAEPLRLRDSHSGESAS